MTTEHRLGPWLLESPLVRDALGERSAARHADGGRRAAVLRLALDGNNPVAQFRFDGRRDALRRLTDPNLLNVIDAGRDGPACYVAFEAVEATTLADRLKAGPVPWQDLFEKQLAEQVLLGLRHGHNLDLVHGNLRPEKILVAADGRAKVTDFGLSDLIDTAGHGDLFADGSIAYLAPERAAGKPAGRRADLFSFGAVLYTLLTGRTPAAGDTLVEALRNQCFTVPERPGRLAELPRELDELVMRLLAKDPERRPSGASELAREVNRLHSKLHRRGDLPDPPRPVPPTEEQPALPKTKPAAAAAGFTPVQMDDPPKPLMQRPAFVIPLAVVLFGLTGWLVWMAGATPPAEELYAEAEALMNSDDPADWAAAWEESLEELTEEYPEYKVGEVRRFQRRLDAWRDLNRSQAAGRAAALGPAGEPERLFRQGLVSLRLGEPAAALRIWRKLADAFAGVPEAKAWVGLAEEGVARAKREAARRPESARRPDPRSDPAVQAAAARVAQLRDAGKAAEAEAIAKSLIELYAGRPEADGLRRLLEPKSAKE